MSTLEDFEKRIADLMQENAMLVIENRELAEKIEILELEIDHWHMQQMR